MTENLLIGKLREYGELSPEVELELEREIKCFSRRKNEFLLREGQVVAGIFMLEQGLARAYFSHNDKEINTWFCTENMITGSILPLYMNKPSFENIQLLEDSIVHFLEVKELKRLYNSYPEVNEIGRKIAEEFCVIMEERITSLHIESAEERYHSLVRTYPDLLQRVNLGHIASYLGITQETLSRIRRR